MPTGILQDWTGSAAERREQGQSFSYIGTPDEIVYLVPRGTKCLAFSPDGQGQEHSTGRDNYFGPPKFQTPTHFAFAYPGSAWFLVVEKLNVQVDPKKRPLPKEIAGLAHAGR